MAEKNIILHWSRGYHEIFQNSIFLLALTAAGQTKRNMNYQFDYTVIDAFFKCEYYTVVIAYV